jgi:prevent-host-death family protein
MPTTVTTTTLRDNLADVLDEVSQNREYLLVTKRGNPVTALVNLDFFEDLLALTSSEYVDSIKEAREDYRRGDIYSHQEVFGEL